MGETLLNIGRVEKRVSIARSTIYKKIKAGSFPKPVKDGNASFWKESDIDQYIDNIIDNSKAA